jgi:mannose-6-phosphate isomerase-like protein (cupin superfamily)
MTTRAPVDVLDLRTVFGVEARVTVPAASTDGAYVEMDCLVAPGSGTMIHYHPDQEESYAVLDGTLEVLLDGRWRPVRSGESLTVPQRAVHGFRNTSTAPVRFLNVHRPALGFEAHLRTVDRLARAGKVRGTSDLGSLMYLSLSAVTHRPDVPVRPPFWVVKLLARLGRALGYRLDE